MMASSEIFEAQKRILCEVQDNQNVLHGLSKGKDGNEPFSADTKLQCAHAQGKYANLKLDFNSLQTKAKLLHYLENVPMREEWSSASVSEEESKQNHRELRKTKQEIRDTQEELEELIEKANTEQDEFDRKLKLLQDKLEDTEQKHKKLAKLQAEHSNRLRGLQKDDNTGIDTMDNFEDILHKQSTALQKVESLLPTYQKAACELKQEISYLLAAKESMTTALEEARPGLERIKEEKEHQRNRQCGIATWCKSAMDKLSHLSGIKQHSFHDDTMTLELISPGDSSVTALLSLRFTAGQHTYSPWQLKNAQLNIESLDITDLVEEAVRINDVVFLVNQVKTRLYSHAPLRHEVEELRHRYALDWLSEEGLIRVMLGDKGQVVCSLTIEPGYPAAGSEVKLRAVEGLQEQISLDLFQPASECPTITEWLDYLHDKVGSG